MHKASEYTFREVTREEAKELVLTKHYLHRMPPLTVAYGAFSPEGEMVGVLTFGKPPSNSLCKGVCGDEYSSQVYELNRLYTEESTPKNLESRFISYTLKDLKPRKWIIISYADTGMNHSGFIYQATNWIYTGLSAKRTDVYVGHNGHSRTYSKEQRDFVVRKIRSMKHRYIYINGDKRFVKDVKKHLKYPIVGEYPKSDPTHYEVGDYMDAMLYNKNTKEIFHEKEFMENPRQYITEEELKDYSELYL